MYLQNREAIQIDSSGEEIRPEGLELFNVVANDMNLRQPPFQRNAISHHWHREMELFYLIEGSVSVEAGGQEIHLESGEGCFINSGVIHAFSNDSQAPYVFRSIVFGADLVGGTPGSQFDLRYIRPLLETGPGILPFTKGIGAMSFFRWFNEVFQACRDEPDGYDIEVRYGLSHIMRMVVRQTGAGGVRPISKYKEDRVKRMLRWIDAHLSDKVTVEDIAAAANIGKRECFRLFQQYLRNSPKSCVNQRRIIAAARRIAATDDPIATIALDCGFATPNYFSKCFQEQMGLPPREWRNTTRLK